MLIFLQLIIGRNFKKCYTWVELITM